MNKIRQTISPAKESFNYNLFEGPSHGGTHTYFHWSPPYNATDYLQYDKNGKIKVWLLIQIVLEIKYKMSQNRNTNHKTEIHKSQKMSVENMLNIHSLEIMTFSAVLLWAMLITITLEMLFFLTLKSFFEVLNPF